MQPTTRDHLLSAARKLFAERGFHGASINQIASAVGLTKQALLHHFATKEKLYGAVLAKLADELDVMMRKNSSACSTPVMRLKRVFDDLASPHEESLSRTQLVIRELMDNKDRAAGAGFWYMRPFLDTLTDLALALPAWQGKSRVEALAFVYHLLGAASYFQISGPTLTGMYGTDTAKALTLTRGHQFDVLLNSAPPETLA